MKKLKSVIKFLWPNPEDMDKDLDVDIENQIIKNKKTGRILKPSLTGSRKKNNTYYTIRVYRNGKRYGVKIHLIFFYKKYKYIPEQIDHIDRDKTNNHIDNLRACTRQLNSFNREKFKLRNNKPLTSIHKSVYFAPKQKNKWVARIRINNKLIRLGSFSTEDIAGEAVNQFYIKNNLIDFVVMNNTPQERVKKNNQFDPLPEEINNIKNLFKNIQPMGDLK